MSKLTSAARKRLPGESFAFPGTKSYPIEDRKHGANALSRVSQHGSPSQKATVKRKVCAKYPSLPSCKGK